MPIPFIAAALTAGKTIFQGIKSLQQKKLAKKLKESTFIPSHLRNKLDQARLRANATMFPGQQQAEDEIRQSSSGAIQRTKRATSSSSDLLNMVGAIDAQEKNATNNLAQQNAEFQERADYQLGVVQSEVAEQQRQNRNEYNATKSALEGASDQNMFNAISGAAEAGFAGAFDGFGGMFRSRKNINPVAKKGIGTSLSPFTPPSRIPLIG